MNAEESGSDAKPFPVAVIEAVLAAGVHEFVVCAGARNSALIVVLAALGDKVRLWQHFDERAAGFFAIGRIRATERPVAVVTTSGTAAAELLPAVIEAHYQDLPLVALTADRPKSYRGSGAPQAIEQAGLFSCYALLSDVSTGGELETAVAAWEASWRCVRPLHVNVCLEEPNTATCTSLREASQKMDRPLLKYMRSRIEAQDLLRRYAEMEIIGFECEGPVAANRLIMVGDLPTHEIGCIRFSAITGKGLIYCEAASGLRDALAYQNRMVRCGDATLRHLPVSEVWRFGSVPSVRYWRDLELNQNVSVHAVTGSGRSGLARVSKTVVEAKWKPLEDAVPADEYLARDAALYARLGELLARFSRSEPGLLRRLSQVIPRGSSVFTGNSLPVREWNLCAEYGSGHRVHVLRGVNGIDGNISAFLGVAADAEESWCITGDLTALYDLNAPWMLKQLPEHRRQFVVIHNGGGRIFSRLSALQDLQPWERNLMENPHNISLRGWAEMWGMGFVSGGVEVLDNVAALPDHAVIELHPDAEQTEAFWNAWAEAEREVWG